MALILKNNGQLKEAILLNYYFLQRKMLMMNNKTTTYVNRKERIMCPKQIKQNLKGTASETERPIP